MRYLYGDSTPSPLDSNYIEFLRDAVEFCVQVLLADQRIVQARVQTRSLDTTTAADIGRLEQLGLAVTKALEAVPAGPPDSPAARCASGIMRAAGDLVRSEIAMVNSTLSAEVERRESLAARERDTSIKALEVLLMKHDLPDQTLDMHLALSAGGRYRCRLRMSTPFELSAVVDLDVPGDNLFAQIVRLDRLVERLEVQAPEMSGWVKKEVKMRSQHLERLHVSELAFGIEGGTLKLRAGADGTGAGFDVLVASDGPRPVRLARIDERGGNTEPPFEAEAADTEKLMSLYQRLAGTALELTSHRRAIVDATIDGESLRSFDKPSLLVERLISTMAPVVQEIASRSRSPGELVLRRLLADDRREEIFLSIDELKRKLDPLVEGRRILFDALWQPEAPRPATAPPPAVIVREQPAAAAPQGDRVTPRSGTLLAGSVRLASPPPAAVATATATAPAATAAATSTTDATPAAGTPLAAAATAPAEASRPEAPRAESLRYKPSSTPALGSRPVTPTPPLGAPASPLGGERRGFGEPLRQRLGMPLLGTASKIATATAGATTAATGPAKTADPSAAKRTPPVGTAVATAGPTPGASPRTTLIPRAISAPAVTEPAIAIPDPVEAEATPPPVEPPADGAAAATATNGTAAGTETDPASATGR